MATVSEPMPSADSQATALERAGVAEPAAGMARVGARRVRRRRRPGARCVAVLTGAVGRRRRNRAAAAPAGGSHAGARAAHGGRIGARRRERVAARSSRRPTPAQQRAAARRLASSRVAATKGAGAPQVHIARRWMEGFYPIYATAQATFGVNWLLLASIHMQESAFSTAPGTYQGLNFAGCCGGPMQFNVTNGPVHAPGTS